MARAAFEFGKQRLPARVVRRNPGQAVRASISVGPCGLSTLAERYGPSGQRTKGYSHMQLHRSSPLPFSLNRGSLQGSSVETRAKRFERQSVGPCGLSTLAERYGPSGLRTTKQVTLFGKHRHFDIHRVARGVRVRRDLVHHSKGSSSTNRPWGRGGKRGAFLLLTRANLCDRFAVLSSGRRLHDVGNRCQHPDGNRDETRLRGRRSSLTSNVSPLGISFCYLTLREALTNRG